LTRSRTIVETLMGDEVGVDKNSLTWSADLSLFLVCGDFRRSERRATHEIAKPGKFSGD